MKKSGLTIAVCVYFLLSLLRTASFSWNEAVTHPDLTLHATNNSVLSRTNGDFLTIIELEKGLDQKLTSEGKLKTILEWFQYGAQLEDASSFLFPIFGTTRSLNHFHNPLKPWSQAGLDDWYIGHWTGESSLVWAQDGNAQQNVVEGDWSWQKTRSYYYTAITSTADSVRQENFAKTFRGLGHQVHLLQDTAVPDHVRNDAHPEDAIFGKNPFTGNAYFESWAKNNPVTINSFAASPIYPNVSFNVSYSGYAPTTQLFDAEIYNGTNPSTSLEQGLSEYTNANFFSNDTIFAAEIYQTDDRHYFPYPKKTSTDLQSFMSGSKAYETITAEDGITDNGYWISKTGDGETINHFLRAGYFTDIVYNAFGEGSLYHSTFYRDEKCHEDYAAKLIPRAVGYSASLLDYFFRGTIDITVPTNGLYSMIDATQPGFNPETTDFTSIKLRAKNTTANNEEMTNGTIQLVVKYKVAHTDPFQSGPVETDADFTYIVVPEKNGVSSLSRSAYTDLNFDLSQNPIPLWATDVYLQVVFKGTLGNEENAVAVGFKDISEPTPIDLFNNMDKICINGNWYEAGSPEAIAQVDSNHDDIANEADVYAYDLRNIYLRFSPYSQNPPYYFASSSAYNIAIPYLYAGEPVRAAYILSDDMFNKGYYMSFVKVDPSDPWTRSDLNQLWWHSAVKRQTDYSEDDELCGGSSPCYLDYYPEQRDVFPADYFPGFYTFRGTSMWWGSVKLLINNPYPTGSQCSFDLL